VVVSRLHRWQIAAGVAIFLLASGLTLRLTFLAGVDRQWAEMRREADRLRADIENVPTVRPVLRGEPLEGNAWLDYEAAVAFSGSTPWLEADWKNLSDYETGRERVDPLLLEAMLSKGPSMFELLAHGARRRQGAYPYAWSQGASMKQPSDKGVSALWRLSRTRGRWLQELGHSRESAELLLDLAQFGRDYTQAAPRWQRLSGQSMIQSALDELRMLVEQGSLDRETRSMIDHALETLERSLPPDQHFTSLDVMAIGYEFHGARDLSEQLRTYGCMCLPVHDLTAWSSWRFGFSERLMAVDGFKIAQSCALFSDGVRGEGWQGCIRAKQFMAHSYHTPNPLLAHVVGGGVPDLYYGLRAQMQLLRAAVRYQGDGQLSDFADPFGGRLHFQQKGARLRIWSVGRNAADDLGTGSWSYYSPTDIVLEVSR
jgi:hypothetical protein